MWRWMCGTGNGWRWNGSRAQVSICQGLGAPISQVMTWLEGTLAPSLSAHPGFFLSYKGSRSEDLRMRGPCLLWAHDLATRAQEVRNTPESCKSAVVLNGWVGDAVLVWVRKSYFTLAGCRNVLQNLYCVLLLWGKKGHVLFELCGSDEEQLPGKWRVPSTE